MENGVEAGNERSDEMIESAWRELGFWAAGLVGGSMRPNVERVLFSPDFCLERLQQHDKLISQKKKKTKKNNMISSSFCYREGRIDISRVEMRIERGPERKPLTRQC